MPLRSYILPTILFLALTPSIAASQLLESGANLFQDYCAQCHGQNGRGGGELVKDRLQPLPDLRTLSARNGNAFPFQRIIETVDGGVEIDMHGEKFMPAWGEVFRFKEDSGEALTHARILNLVWYLNKIQVD